MKIVNKVQVDLKDDKTNSNNVNRGQPIYYKNILHYIVYEFDDNIIISKEMDLSKSYCVKKKKVSIKPKK
jgi:hypothetical protein